MAYSKKIVAFIDLLGFKELNGQTDQKQTIHNVLTKNEDIVRMIEELPSSSLDSCAIRMFSDSIFFSYPAEMFTALLRDLSFISSSVAKQGFFFRGAVTYGDVFDTGTTLYGPALIEAYELEAKTACYPRIIITQKAYRKLKHNPEATTAATAKDFLLKDFDEQVFINFLKEQTPTDLNETREVISKYIKKNKKKSAILPKYLWLANYFNHFIKVRQHLYDPRFDIIAPINIELPYIKLRY